MRVMNNQRVPVEDGITLGTDVYLPDGPGSFPVILSRTPYCRSSLVRQAAFFTSYGYAMVAQDIRGCFGSDSVFEPLAWEEHDGYASLDWIANQRWCNGRIGMCGASYGGIVQWYAALSGHEALRCIAPMVAPGSFMREWIRYSGCFAWANMIRWVQMWTQRPVFKEAVWEQVWQLRNLEAVKQACGFLSPTLKRWFELDQDNDYWRRLDVLARADELRVPILHTAGWWDHISSLHMSLSSRERSPTDPPQFLRVGPWGHSGSTVRGADIQLEYGDWSFSYAAHLDTHDLVRRFLDRFLKEDDGAFGGEPFSRVFIMGSNSWLSSDRWPPAQSRQHHLYLDGDGSAASTEGRLREDIPERTGEMRYTYDPADPCPTRGGPIYWGLAQHYGCGPVDMRSLLTRPDVAVFRSAPMPTPLTLVGPVELRLAVTADVEDTDLIVRLAVEDSVDQGVRPLLVGSLRLCYRNSYADPQPLQVGAAHSATIALGSTAYQFPRGSRLVLAITSSDFPRILPHTNQFRLANSDEPPRRASIRLHSGGSDPARLTLHVMPEA
jgi:hypothetical protein